MAFIYVKNSTIGQTTGDATAANQSSQISLATAGNLSLVDILNAINTANQGTNSGSLSDTSRSQTLTGSLVALGSSACKYVTLINLSTNTASISYSVNGGATLTLEAGYSVKLNVSNASLITASSSAGEALQYIVTD